MYLVLLSASDSINLNVKDHETKNKMLVDIKYEQEKMVAASTSTILLVKSHDGWELGCQKIVWYESEILPALFIPSK